MAPFKPKLLLPNLPLPPLPLPLLSAFIIIAALSHTTKVHSQAVPDVTTFFALDIPQLTQLTFQGDANLASANSNLSPALKFIRLTKTNNRAYPLTASAGGVLYSNRVQFWDTAGRQASFETTIAFEITTLNNNPADGIIAFFIAPLNSAINSSGGSLGISDPISFTSPFFAVEIDIYCNHVWDPKYPHIGIDINSLDSAAVTPFNSTLGQVVIAHINYDPITQKIRVGTINSATQQIFNVSHVFNLTTILPQQVQVGISASTGAHVACFDVHSWQFTSTLV